MPIYTYRCRECNNQFETRQRMTDDPLTDCPVCGGEIRRVVNSVGVVFKGKGFYVTDNRSGKNAALPSASGGKEEKTEKADSTDTATDSSKKENSSKKETKAEKSVNTAN